MAAYQSWPAGGTRRWIIRFCVERCGFGRTAATVRVADGEPGAECQLDFGYLGLLADPVTGRQRKVQALIFTACYSRHERALWERGCPHKYPGFVPWMPRWPERWRRESSNNRAQSRR
jgi:hypothetical protein